MTMESKYLFMVVAMVAAIVAPAIAKEIVVGDDKGWTLNFDYKTWAEGKQFFVGDTLVFNYPAGKHNVVKVNGTDFQLCATPQTPTLLNSGNDKIPLTTPGRKWYICSVSTHCADGPMKLFINVWPVGYAPAPSPTAGSSAAFGIAPAASFLMAALVSSVALVMA